MIRNLLLVGLGGAIGSMIRYACQKWFNDHSTAAFPWATFAINITGCLLIGIFCGIAFKSFQSNENWKLFLMTGLCGGFTTFSAFTLESIGLIREQKTFLFLSYIAATVILCLFATYAGMKLSRQVF